MPPLLPAVVDCAKDDREKIIPKRKEMWFIWTYGFKPEGGLFQKQQGKSRKQWAVISYQWFFINHQTLANELYAVNLLRPLPQSAGQAEQTSNFKP